MSQLLPMDTLPYWPEVVDPTALQLLWVLLGIPILITVVIVVLVWAPNLVKTARGGRPTGTGCFWINPGSKRVAGTQTSEDAAPYTVGERESLIRAARRAEEISGLEWSIFIGAAEGAPAEDFAIDLLDSLPDPERSLLILWDPQSEDLEFVSGDETDRVLSHNDFAQAAAEVRTSAEAGLAVDGLVRAINLLADHAQQPEVLHSDRSLVAAE